jgi:DNA (cytosine-5)-methyltransferase 1
VDSTKEHKIISICSGSLGIERGLHRAGANVRTVAYVEIEAFINFNLVAAMETGLVDKAPIWTDLQTFDGKPFHKRIHGIVGGYPCQGESFAGQRKLTEDPRFLYPHIERIIKSTKPIWCFFENVQGHLSGSFIHVLKSLQSMGYKVEAGLYTACEVGAPHQRKRIFILACSNITELRECVANPNNQHGSQAKVTKWSNKDSGTNGGTIVGNTNGKGL